MSSKGCNSISKVTVPSSAYRQGLRYCTYVLSPFTDALPKTRSGKITRRILREITSGEIDSIGDITTLTDPKIVDTLIKG